MEIGETLEAAWRANCSKKPGSGHRRTGRRSARSHRTDAGRTNQYHFVIIDYLCHATNDDLVCGSDADDAVGRSRRARRLPGEEERHRGHHEGNRRKCGLAPPINPYVGALSKRHERLVGCRSFNGHCCDRDAHSAIDCQAADHGPARAGHYVRFSVQRKYTGTPRRTMINPGQVVAVRKTNSTARMTTAPAM